VVPVTLAGGELVEAQETTGQAGDGAGISRAEAGAIAAGLLDGLGELGVAHVGALALEDEPGGFQLVILVGIDDDIGSVVGRAARYLDFETDALGTILILVDQLGPELGAHLFLGIGPAFRVIRVDVVDTLCFPLAGDFGVAVFDGLFEVGLRLGGHSVSDPY
jgi:hypothetical protein